MTNHIHLIMRYTSQLMDLAMAQSWIDGVRKAAPNNQEIQLNMDRQQDVVVSKQERLHNEMFEISRSN